MNRSKPYDFEVFSVRIREKVSEHGTSKILHTLSCPDWVNVIAFTRDRRLALVKQYRLGINEHTIELPGGIVASGKSLLCEAQNELLEETGLSSDEWHQLSKYRPNPALQDNWCHSFVCSSAEKNVRRVRPRL